MVATAVADFVSYEECRAEAEALLERKYPDVVNFALGPELGQFCVLFAANVAWRSAAKATVRAQGGICRNPSRT